MLGMLLIAVVTILNIDNVTADPVAVIVTYEKLFASLTSEAMVKRAFQSRSTSPFDQANGIQLEGITALLGGDQADFIYKRCTQTNLAMEFPIIIVLGIGAEECSYKNTTLGCKQSATLSEVTTLLKCVLTNIESVIGGLSALSNKLFKGDLGKAAQVLLFLVFALVTEVIDLLRNLNVADLLYPFLPIILGAVVFFLGLGLFISESSTCHALGYVVCIVYALLMPILTPVFYLLGKTTAPLSFPLGAILGDMADTLDNLLK